jgi:hypothetical protein
VKQNRPCSLKICHQFDNTLPDAGAGRFVASAQHSAIDPHEKPKNSEIDATLTVDI